MSPYASISPDKLWRRLGRADAPGLIDVRTAEDFAADPFLVPGAVRRSPAGLADRALPDAGRPVVAICRHGGRISHGVAALLRQEGVAAEVLEGGTDAWAAAGLPRVPDALLPARDAAGRTLWVTRARPKIDRIACPWLIRRFVDPAAVFLFVPPGEVLGVGERFAATPFDLDGPGVFWTHRGELCTFDVMVEEFGLGGVEALAHLARIVRGADTARLDLELEAAGLLAVSLGLSRMYADDLAQLEAGLPIYDAFYRWCRDATGETHNWPSAQTAVAPA
jgi:rhodanese-related sulfurtransferase